MKHHLSSFLAGSLLLLAILLLSGCSWFESDPPETEPPEVTTEVAEEVPVAEELPMEEPEAPLEVASVSEAQADAEHVRKIEEKELELEQVQDALTPIARVDENDQRTLQLYEPDPVPEADPSYDPNDLGEPSPYFSEEAEPPPAPMSLSEYEQALESALLMSEENSPPPPVEVEPLPYVEENTQSDLLQEIYLGLIDLRDRGLPPVRNPLIEQLLPNVYFAFDQSRIEPDYLDLINQRALEVMQALELRGDMILQVEGHADERGSDEYNLALGHRRANAVYEVLRIYSADSNLLRTISFGEEFPAVPESTPEAWAKNRRVSFTFLLRD